MRTCNIPGAPPSVPVGDSQSGSALGTIGLCQVIEIPPAFLKAPPPPSVLKAISSVHRKARIPFLSLCDSVWGAGAHRTPRSLSLLIG